MKNKPKVFNSWSESSRPFERVHIDFCHFRGREILIFVDSYSKWIEAKLMKYTDTISTLQKLEEIFITFGYPELIVSDNGPPFQGRVFQEYLKSKGIKYLHSPPRHPQSNGIAERAVQTFKSKMEKFCSGATFLTHSQIQKLINKFLFNYRNQPTTQNNIVPSHRIFSHRPRWLLEVATTPAKILNYEVNHDELKTLKNNSCNEKNYDRNHELNSPPKTSRKTSQSHTPPKLQFKEGEMILYTTEFKGNTVNYKGKVLQKLSEYVYIIQLETSHTLKAHLNSLRKYVQREEVFRTVDCPASDEIELNPESEVNNEIEVPSSSESHSTSEEEFESLENSLVDQAETPEPRKSKRNKKPVDRLQYK
jgi:hypothetical protein